MLLFFYSKFSGRGWHSTSPRTTANSNINEADNHLTMRSFLCRAGLEASDGNPLAPFESHWLRLARDFTQHHGESPLFPALEAAALWNGFQQMSRADLEKQVKSIEEILTNGGVPWGNKRRAQKVPGVASDGQLLSTSPESEAGTEKPPLDGKGMQDLLTGNADVIGDLSTSDLMTSGQRSITALEDGGTVPSSPGDPPPTASERPVEEEYGHSWSVESEMLCKFLMGCCHKHLGETDKASDALAFAISVGQNIGG
jgi:hypothetical protein